MRGDQDWDWQIDPQPNTLNVSFYHIYNIEQLVPITTMKLYYVVFWLVI